MTDNPLLRLADFGQSIWLDSVRRAMLVSGKLVSLIQESGVSGVGFSAAAMAQALASGTDYDGAIADMALRGLSSARICQSLALDDVRLSADLMRPIYDRLDGRDGFASIQVSPYLAHDCPGMLREARRLWELVDRPNLLIGIPGTQEALGAVRQLTREGLNVQVNLLFGTPRYRAVAGAYLDGLAERAAHGLAMERVASVAAFPLGRIDQAVDPLLTRLAALDGRLTRVVASLKGETGVACAKAARRVYLDLISEDRYLALAARGARPQRLLWTGVGEASPGCLNYLEALIGSDTVAGASLSILTAYRDYGSPAPRLDQGLQEALGVLSRVSELGIDLNSLSRELEEEGVRQLGRSFDRLIESIELRRLAAVGQLSV